MILNAYAVLDAFVVGLRVLLALAVLALGVVAWRRCRSGLGTAGKSALEERAYLLYLLALWLLVLGVVSWPLFYLLLQSYVPQWPGVMCIYGVTRVGAGSQGASRFLPGLVQALEVTKPALVFLSGAWLVLYLVNRRTQTAPLARRTLALVVVFSLLALADALAEAAYLVIPKKEEFLAGGCCTEAFDAGARAARLVPAMLLSESQRPWLWAGYYAGNGLMILALGGVRWLLRRGRGLWWLALLVPGAVGCLAVSAVFLTEIAAPALLHLPYHHCPYDLVPRVPESMVAVALFLLGTFAVGWAGLAGGLARCRETETFLARHVGRLLYLAECCYLGSLVMMSVELALA
jgi:hypothetical protein